METERPEELPKQEPKREGPTREGPSDGAEAEGPTVTYVAPNSSRLVGATKVKPAQRQAPTGLIPRLFSAAKNNAAKPESVATSDDARGRTAGSPNRQVSKKTSTIKGKPKLAKGEGVVVGTEPSHGEAHVHFANRSLQLPSGTQLTVYRLHGSHRHTVGQVVVDKSSSGASHVRAFGKTSMEAIRPGDIVTKTGAKFLSVAFMPGSK